MIDTDEFRTSDRLSRSKSEAEVFDGKIILIGSTGVGKSNIVSRYTENKFGEKAPTVGLDFASKKL